jgi:hypothetical protein
VVARGPLQSHSEGVVLFVYSFSVLISLAAAEWHWIVAQNTRWKCEGIPSKPRIGLLEASDFQL